MSYMSYFLSEGGGPLWKSQKCWFPGQECQECRYWFGRRTCMRGCYETTGKTFLLLNSYIYRIYNSVYISVYVLLSSCLTDSGGWEWQDSRCQIQNIWLWLSYCFQLTGHWVGEGEIGESLWLRPLHEFTVWSHCTTYLFSEAFLPTFQWSLFHVQIDEALKIKNTEIAKELCLPPVKLHCSSKCQNGCLRLQTHWLHQKKCSDFIILCVCFFFWQCLQRMPLRLR